MSKLSRRDILKLSLATLGGAALTTLAPSVVRQLRGAPSRPNILILVFDTLSAPHMSAHGYERATTPNLDRFAESATIYHNHYSAGSFTTPGTASILTGLDPWHHRAVNPSGLVKRSLASNNIFRLAQDDYFRVGFTQNLMAEVFLRQFHRDLDLHLPTDAFAYKNPLLLGNLDQTDPLAYLAYDDFLVGGYKFDTPYPGSVSLGVLDQIVRRGLGVHPELKRGNRSESCFNGYFYYQNRVVFDGIHRTLQKLSAEQSPYFGYFHLWSPHEPYAPTKEFAGLFEDNMKVPVRPNHPHALGSLFTPKQLLQIQQVYDQYVANVDAEFGRLMETMSAAGMLDNTYVIVLSDHGQLFERGVHGHASRLLYDGVLHVPLLVRSPGQTRRVDIRSATSNVDLAPTLASIMGSESPGQTDGRLLPGLGGEEDPDRSVFSVLANESSAFGHLNTGTFVLIKGMRKLMFYTGYDGFEDIVELYDLEADPFELNNIAEDDPVTAKRMKEELLETREAADKEK